MMNEDLYYYQEFVEGSDSAFTYLLEKYGDKLTLFINTYVSNYHTAEDLMEDCFVDLLLHKKRFRKESSFRTYLYQIAKFKAFNYLKRRKHIQFVGEEALQGLPSQAENCLEELVKQEEYRTLYRLLQKLPENYKQAIHLYYFEEMTYEEIAAIMEKDVKQIDNYLYRAKQRIKDLYGMEEE